MRGGGGGEGGAPRRAVVGGLSTGFLGLCGGEVVSEPRREAAVASWDQFQSTIWVLL